MTPRNGRIPLQTHAGALYQTCSRFCLTISVSMFSQVSLPLSYT